MAAPRTVYVVTRNSRNTPDSAESVNPDKLPLTSAWLISAAGTALAALAMLIMAGMAAFGVISGGASTISRALTEAAVLLVLAVGVGLLTLNLLRRKSLAKTPTVLWNGLLVPVAFSLMSGGAKAFGAVTLAVAVVTFFAALSLPRFEPADEENDRAL